MSTYFLAVQSTYSGIELGIFNGIRCIALVTETKYAASKNFVPLLDQLLVAQQLILHDLAFIAVNIGPGPFTTLRTVIATANGLSFATNIPLIGITTFDAMSYEYRSDEWNLNVYLLDAFGQKVYYAIQHKETAETIGCANISLFLEQLKATYTLGLIRFIGNGAQKHQEAIRDIFLSAAQFSEPSLEGKSLCCLAQSALDQWHKTRSGVSEVAPVYFELP